MNGLHILLVDDHEIVRIGLTTLLNQYPQFEVVGGASSADQAIEMIRQLHPHVVILDIRLGKDNGIELCKYIVQHFPESRVIVLSAFDDDELIFAAIMAGAKGYVLKEVGTNELIRALEAVSRGESLLDPVITKKILERMRTSGYQHSSELDSLTKQERKVLGLIAQGKTNREIASNIYLSEKTVRNYVSNILNKLNLSNRSEAAVYATRNKLYSEPGS